MSGSDLIGRHFYFGEYDLTRDWTGGGPPKHLVYLFDVGADVQEACFETWHESSPKHLNHPLIDHKPHKTSSSMSVSQNFFKGSKKSRNRARKCRLGWHMDIWQRLKGRCIKQGADEGTRSRCAGVCGGQVWKQWGELVLKWQEMVSVKMFWTNWLPL